MIAFIKRALDRNPPPASKPLPIWDGVYPDFASVPVAGQGYDEAGLVEEMVRNVGQARDEWNRCKDRPAANTLDHMHLAVLAGIHLGSSASLTVLDFGGGVGIGYAAIRQSVKCAGKIRYHVVEREVMARAGQRLWADDQDIAFHAELPPCDTACPDLIYVSTALQYIEDYSAALVKLCEFRAKYMLFARLSAVRCTSFVTAQRNLPGVVIPYWFINLDEIAGLVAGYGYRIAFQGSSSRVYGQDNFPPDKRMIRASDVLFVRE